MVRLAITGYPTAGKSTLAKRLAQDLGATVHAVRDIAALHGCIDDKDTMLEADIIDEMCLQEALQKELTAHDNIIIDGHLSHAAPHDKLDHVIFVKCATHVVRQRMVQREYSKEKIDENLDAINFFIIEEELKEAGIEPVVYDGSDNNEARYQALLDAVRK